MTQPGPAEPLRGPARPAAASGGRPAGKPAPAGEGAAPGAAEPPGETSFENLDQRPVSEHVALFETEHARLQRELGTIDQV